MAAHAGAGRAAAWLTESVVAGGQEPATAAPLDPQTQRFQTLRHQNALNGEAARP